MSSQKAKVWMWIRSGSTDSKFQEWLQHVPVNVTVESASMPCFIGYVGVHMTQAIEPRVKVEGPLKGIIEFSQPVNQIGCIDYLPAGSKVCVVEEGMEAPAIEAMLGTARPFVEWSPNVVFVGSTNFKTDI